MIPGVVQLGEIGFYTDVFSVVFAATLLIATSSRVVLQSCRRSPVQFVPTDVAYLGLAVVCLLSFLVSCRDPSSYHNVLLVVGGCVIYLAVRQGRGRSDPTSLVLVLALACAVHGFLQYAHGQQVQSVFSNENILAMVLAVLTPVLLSNAIGCWHVGRARCWLTWCVVVSCVACIVLARSRTGAVSVAMGATLACSPFLINTWRQRADCAGLNTRERTVRYLIVMAVVFVPVVCVASANKNKALSASGRTLGWNVAFDMLCERPLTGVGFGNFAITYNQAQAAYFAMGRGSARERMAADACRHAFNEPLEAAAELGIPGVLLLGLFCVLVLGSICRVVRKISGRRVGCVAVCTPREAQRLLMQDTLSAGMAGSAVAFMTASLFHFPRKTVLLWLVFNYAVASIVNVEVDCQDDKRRDTVPPSSTVRYCVRVFWLTALVASLVVARVYIENFADFRKWVHAEVVARNGSTAEARQLYSSSFPRFQQDGRFCSRYAQVLMASEALTGEHAKSIHPAGSGSEEHGTTAILHAVRLLESGKYTYPDPYMFENLSMAYLRLSNGTNWPVLLQTHYRHETPLQAAIRRLREWRCGTNLFFEPPPTLLTRGDCVGRAVHYLTLASDILPWRLTSKWYLARIYRDSGDVSDAVRYAQLVVNIPMKKWTREGVIMKQKAHKMLSELGVQCDDPGIVVFDIYDRRTWNEGKW